MASCPTKALLYTPFVFSHYRGLTYPLHQVVLVVCTTHSVIKLSWPSLSCRSICRYVQNLLPRACIYSRRNVFSFMWHTIPPTHLSFLALVILTFQSYELFFLDLALPIKSHFLLSTGISTSPFLLRWHLVSKRLNNFLSLSLLSLSFCWLATNWLWLYVPLQPSPHVLAVFQLASS